MQMALMWQSISFQELDDGDDEVDRGKDKIKKKTLTRSEKHDGYELEYSVSVKYNSTKKLLQKPQDGMLVQ